MCVGCTFLVPDWNGSCSRSSSSVERSQRVSVLDPRACLGGRCVLFSILELCREVAVFCSRSSSSVERSLCSALDPRALSRGRCVLFSILELVERSQTIALCLCFQSAARGGGYAAKQIAVLRRAELRTAGLLCKPKNSLSDKNFATSRQARGSRIETLCDLSTGSRIEKNRLWRKCLSVGISCVKKWVELCPRSSNFVERSLCSVLDPRALSRGRKDSMQSFSILELCREVARTQCNHSRSSISVERSLCSVLDPRACREVARTQCNHSRSSSFVERSQGLLFLITKNRL